jgi:nitrate/nitrite transporter NarK
LSLFLTDRFGTSQEMVGVFYSIVWIGGVVAGPLGGYLSDRFGPVPVTVGMFLVSAPFIYLLNIVPFGVVLVAVLIILQLVVSMRMAIAQVFVINHTQERHQSTLVGILFFSSSEVGSVLVPALGKLIDLFGFYVSFSISAAATLIVTIGCWVWLSYSRD